MQWTKVNNVILTNEWQLLETSNVEGSVFRITQSWDVYPQACRGLIAQSLTTSPFQFFGARSFYPSEDLRILKLEIPKEFLIAGITSRYLLMKIYSKRQFTYNWSITVEAFSNL